MVIRIPEPTSWRTEARLYAFGDYRIPEDMPLEIAERAVAEGAAVVVQTDEPPKRAGRQPKVSS